MKLRRQTMVERRAGGKVMEGSVKKGGTKPMPSSPKPNIKPAGQNPTSPPKK